MSTYVYPAFFRHHVPPPVRERRGNWHLRQQIDNVRDLVHAGVLTTTQAANTLRSMLIPVDVAARVLGRGDVRPL